MSDRAAILFMSTTGAVSVSTRPAGASVQSINQVVVPPVPK
jgi:hypothetical protein